MAWALSAITYAYAGNLEEAERRNNRYKTLSPFDPHAFFFDAFFVLIHLMKRDYETAVAVGQSSSSSIRRSRRATSLILRRWGTCGAIRRRRRSANVCWRSNHISPLSDFSKTTRSNASATECTTRRVCALLVFRQMFGRILPVVSYTSSSSTVT